MPSLFPPSDFTGVGAGLSAWLKHCDIPDEHLRALLCPKLSDIAPPHRMKDAEAALDRLQWAIDNQQRICLFGDYDVDGTLSASLLTHLLRRLGGDVRVLIAKRFDGGYGLSSQACEDIQALRPNLVVTLDCGSTDHDRIQTLSSLNVETIVIDHHRVPAEPLKAAAFLNPHQPGCDYPFKDLCTAGLAFVIGAALRTRMGQTIDMKYYLPWVALATIADVMPLSHAHTINRALVKHGLQRLSMGEDLPVGLRVMREMRQTSWVLSDDVAFQWAPRINAAGRLGDATTVVNLMLSEDGHEARALAQALEAFNTERKIIERSVTEAALRMAQAQVDEGRDAIVVWGPWHRGVVGIVAARLVSRFELPTLVVALHDGVGHGSGRLPADTIDLYEALHRCRSHLLGYGGHAAAVGLSVTENELEVLRETFCKTCRSLKQDTPLPSSSIGSIRMANRDRSRSSDETNVLIDVDELLWLEPFGFDHPKPRLSIESARVRQTKRFDSGFFRTCLGVNGENIWCVPAFGKAEHAPIPEPGQSLNARGRLRVETWRDELKRVLELESWQVT